MARPKKEGLDYFPLDVDMDQDDKIALVEAKHGLEGFAVIVRLLMKIYKTGYFYEWTEKEQLLFSKRVYVNINRLNEIVNDCLQWNLFNQKVFLEHKVLTSSGIQRRYLEAIGRRKEVVLNQNYLLIDPYKHLNEDKIAITFINESNNGINVDINNQNENINPQSKVKESKENKRYMNLAIHGNDFLNIYNQYFMNHFNIQHMQVTEEQQESILNQLNSMRQHESMTASLFEELTEYHFDNLPDGNNGNILYFLTVYARYLNILRADDPFN